MLAGRNRANSVGGGGRFRIPPNEVEVQLEAGDPRLRNIVNPGLPKYALQHGVDNAMQARKVLKERSQPSTLRDRDRREHRAWLYSRLIRSRSRSRSIRSWSSSAFGTPLMLNTPVSVPAVLQIRSE
jgi:hypothetical protein